MDIKFIKTHNCMSVVVGDQFLLKKSFIDLNGIYLNEHEFIEVTAVNKDRVVFHKIPVTLNLVPLKLEMMKDLFLRSLDVGIIDSIKLEEES